MEYPSGEELKRLREWPESDCAGALAYAAELWAYPDAVKCEGRTFTFITLGWSGNEDIIEAIGANKLLWFICWQLSERGGRFVFEAPDYQAANV